MKRWTEPIYRRAPSPSHRTKKRALLDGRNSTTKGTEEQTYNVRRTANGYEQNLYQKYTDQAYTGPSKILKGLGLVRENSIWVRAELENKGVLLCFRKIHLNELAWKSR